MASNDLSQPLQELSIETEPVTVNYADSEWADMKVVNLSSIDLSQTFQEKLSIDETVPVNYAVGKSAEVKVLKILEDLLVNSGDSRRDIVIVGEGNFTFSIALAVLRGSSWDGIVSTRYENESLLPQISDVKLKSIKFCAIQSLKLNIASEHTLSLTNIRAITDLPSPPDGAWKFGIDATNLPADLSVDKKVVWFQCPWIPRNIRSGIYDLISKFLQHMGEKQSVNDYVLIGIANHDDYVKAYQLGKLLGETLSGPVGKYEFLGVDDALIKKIIKFGYKHKSWGETYIHDRILDHHLTLIFKHQGP